MSIVEQKIVRWVSRALADLTEDGPIHRIELFHSIEHEHTERLAIFRIEEGADATETAQSIWDVAEADAESRISRGVQRYIIATYRREDSQQNEAQLAFLLKPSEIETRLGGETEPPTDKGILAHYMRHDENMHNLTLKSLSVSSDRLLRDLESERHARLRAEEALSSLVEKQQELLDRSHERKLAEAREEARARRHEQMLSTIMAMAPLLMSRFMGGGMTAAGSSSRDQAIGSLLKGLSQEEAVKVFGALQPQNQMMLMELYQSYREDEEKRQKELPEMLRDKEGTNNGDEEEKGS